MYLYKMGNKYLFIFLLLIPNISIAKAPDIECIDWFKDSKIQSGTQGCPLKCATLGVDMGTFHCPNQCDVLCKPKDESSDSASNLIIYPGLTPAEKKLIFKNPGKALIVYNQKNVAEESSARNFPDQNLNDESDAFRHFIWAALLTKELGISDAKEFLNAHEEDPDQPEKEREMDLYNNRRGQLAAEKLINDNNWNLNNIEKSGLQELRTKQMQVLKPGLFIPKDPK